jgi:RNA polymerase sigma factor for flagellar operon FliA
MKSATSNRKRISPQESLALWQEYKRTGDVQARNRLVMTYAPLVKYIVFKKVRELPARCEVEDFISCGLEALIASIDRFDPDKGATLEQFAWTRIHGAVLDELRRQDWAPRSLRRWERDIAKAREQFTAVHGRRPSREELADALSISVEDLRTREDDIAVSDVTSLNTLVISDDETTVERIDTLADGDSRLDPEHAARHARPRSSSAARSTRCRSASARSPSCSTSRTSRCARSARSRRLREPRLPDPLAAQAHAEVAARRGQPALLGRRLSERRSRAAQVLRRARRC